MDSKKLIAAEMLAKIYFEIASIQIGEDAVRRIRDKAIKRLKEDNKYKKILEEAIHG